MICCFYPWSSVPRDRVSATGLWNDNSSCSSNEKTCVQNIVLSPGHWRTVTWRSTEKYKEWKVERFQAVTAVSMKVTSGCCVLLTGRSLPKFPRCLLLPSPRLTRRNNPEDSYLHSSVESLGQSICCVSFCCLVISSMDGHAFLVLTASLHPDICIFFRVRRAY
jgi:hypothetical protein